MMATGEANKSPLARRVQQIEEGRMGEMKKLVTFTGILAVAILAAAQAHATLLVNETFSYPNGNLAGNTPVSNGGIGGTWATYSGTPPTDIQVVGGQANPTQVNAPDDAISFDGGFAADTTSGKIYASFDLTLAALPPGTSYFALFKDSGASNFGARIFVNQTGATAGDYSLGIANSAATANQYISTALTVGTTYKVVMEVDNSASGDGSLWLNPVLESDTHVTDTVGPHNNAWSTFALRQSATGGSGTELVDNLLVGTTFGDVVVPEPSTVMLVGTGLLGLLALRRRHS
jgi:hypothetical protein